jgi:hypothetical protein
LEFLENAKINYLRKKKIKHLEFYKEKNVNNLEKTLLGMTEYSIREKNILCKNRLRSGLNITEIRENILCIDNLKTNLHNLVYKSFKVKVSFIQEYRNNIIKSKRNILKVKKEFKNFNSDIRTM